MVDGPALVIVSVGAVFVYAGVTGKGVLKTVQSVIQGAGPAKVGQSNPAIPPGAQATSTGISAGVSGGTTGVSGGASGGSVQNALASAAAQYEWNTGAQWQALVQLATNESGMSSTAKNPSSGAYGVAQSLGHHFAGGPAPNGVNEYGGNGLSAAESRAASLGDPVPQCKWMVRYIKGSYGDPVNALRKWQSRNPHWY